MKERIARPDRKSSIKKMYPTQIEALAHNELIKRAMSLRVENAGLLDTKELVRAIALAEIRK